jgi:Leucine-rich repeat (LRR) protein
MTEAPWGEWVRGVGSSARRQLFSTAVSLASVIALAAPVAAVQGDDNEIEEPGLSAAEVQALRHFESSGLGVSLAGQYRKGWLLLKGKMTDADWVHLHSLVNLRALTLNSPHLTDMELLGLRGLDRLESFSLLGSNGVVGPGLVHLRLLGQLTSLALPSGFPEQGLQYVAALEKLESLSIHGTTFSENAAGLRRIKELKGLQDLTLKTTNITDEGLAHLAELTQLRRLDLRSNHRITDAGIVHLADLDRLEWLDVSELALTDVALSHLGGLSNLQTLILPARGITGVGFEHLADLTTLTTLRPGKSVTDEGLRHIGALRSLNSLTLSETPITEVGLSHLSGLNELEQLDLRRTPMTAVGLRGVGELRGLKSLTLSRTAISDEGLAYLGELAELEVLHLEGTRITDAALVHLKPLKKLRRLDLPMTRISDEGLAHLVELPNLEYLDLGHDAISDAGLDHVKQMRNLRWCGTFKTSVTDRGRDELRLARPELAVD